MAESIDFSFEEISAAEHYLRIGWRTGREPGPQFEGNFLYPYYCSVGLYGPPVLTYMALQAAGWPVYATQAETRSIVGSPPGWPLVSECIA